MRKACRTQETVCVILTCIIAYACSRSLEKICNELHITTSSQVHGGGRLVSRFPTSDSNEPSSFLGVHTEN